MWTLIKLIILRKSLILFAAALMISWASMAQNVETLDVSMEKNGPFSTQVGEYLIEGKVLNGLKEGTWYEYHANKHLLHRMIQFEKGKKNGAYLEVDETGALVKKAEYSDDEYDGVVYTWYRGGKLSNKSTYRKGVMDGEQIQCYDQGGNKEIANYKNGLRDGMTTWFDQGGNKVMTIEYKEGRFEGKQETFYKTGGVKTLKTFKNNIQEGPAIEYYEGGSIQSECNYKGGKVSGNVKHYKDMKPYVEERAKEQGVKDIKEIKKEFKQEMKKEVKKE